MDEDQSNQMLLLPQFTQSVRDHYRLPSQIREQVCLYSLVGNISIVVQDF